MALKKPSLSLSRFGALLMSAFVAMFLLLPSSAFAQQVKIGYVNLQRAINEVEEGKTAKAKLKKDFEKKQAELDKLQNDLKKMKSDFESQTMMLSEDAKRKKAGEFQQKMMELQQTYMKLQSDLAQAEAKATKSIFDKMGKIIEQIAKEQKYDLVLERTESAVLYAREEMDLTNELIKRYNGK